MRLNDTWLLEFAPGTSEPQSSLVHSCIDPVEQRTGMGTVPMLYGL